MACVSRSSSCRLFSRAVISTPPAGADVALAVCAEGEPVAASGGAAAAGCCGCGCMSGLVLTAAAAVGLPATLSLLPYIKSCIRCGDGRRATTTARGCAGVAPGRPTACRLGVTTTAAVIARHANDAQILTMEGYPMMVTKFHADVQFTAAPDGSVSCRFPQLQQWFCGKVLLLEALAAAGCWLLRNPRPLCAAVRSWRPARPDTLAAAGARRHGAGKCSPGWWRRP